MTATKISYATCPLCEATCGLEIETRIASEHAGVNTNILTDEVEVDPLSGNAVLNGIPVAVEKVLANSRHHAS